MAKEIKITLYSPRELWVKFWNSFYWPRRKKCAEWLEYGQSEVEYKIVHEVLLRTEQLGINIKDEELVKLECAIKPKISEAFDELRKVITITLE